MDGMARMAGFVRSAWYGSNGSDGWSNGRLVIRLDVTVESERKLAEIMSNTHSAFTLVCFCANAKVLCYFRCNTFYNAANTPCMGKKECCTVIGLLWI